ncbi:MAG: hypothetical protein HN411_06415 [Waddliaceae bacterium]|nr:hypothetical protein [Waddliaceae bacterium]MBT3578882.1 hypothetical protein [Waddliaceae bacterium]MBT4445042.1 hypothetical protein [Waddliaceae bacterium]MBT6929050.1 hypothetical protein [Waddliaceae bacterium]MBT7264049.1 hypothetical protein [Waddliaceae bacterium]
MVKSDLWQRQHDEYQRHGVQAWQKNMVPWFLTSNTLIASHYVNIVDTFVEECINNDIFDTTKPLTIVDLGAGAGRFAFLFLKEILPRLKKHNVSIRYVMTDISEENMSHVASHPLLKKYFDDGTAHTAFFNGNDADGAAEILLNESRENLSQEALENPLVAIGGYFFDIIVNDIFIIRDGTLYKRNIQYADGDLWPVVSEKISYHDVPATQPYYSDGILDSIVEKYSTTYDNIAFGMPVGACNTIRRLNAMSKGHMLLLAADQGIVTDEQMKQCSDVKVSCHGSFSVPVNYNAIDKYITAIGGTFVAPNSPHSEFVSTMSLLTEGKPFPATEKAYRDTIVANDIYDYYLRGDKVSSMNDMLSLLDDGNGDTMTLYHLLQRIEHAAPSATDAEKQRLADHITRATDNFFPLSSDDMAFFKIMEQLLTTIGFNNKTFPSLSSLSI